MKKTVFAICLALIFATNLRICAQITAFDDIVTWAGTGTNQSALIVQWNDGNSPTALAWGFRWIPGSTPNVSDMLLGVMNADVGLFGRGDSATNYGAAYYGFGYDANHDGSFGVTGAQDYLGDPVAITFASGFSDMNVNSLATEAPWSSTAASPSSPSDRYKEAWYDNGSWAQLYGGSGVSYSPTWAASWTGAGEPLVNNGWYGFTFGPVDSNWNSLAPVPTTVLAAVPEPTAFALVLLAFIPLLYARKRLHAC